MGGTLGYWMGELRADEAMALSASALDGSMENDAELLVSRLTTAATVRGAFEARVDGVLVRGSGGPSVSVGQGTLHVLLRLRAPSALLPCDARKVVNRYVRPLLKALPKQGAQAHYFGRDWISVKHRPVGEVVFAHDSRSGRTAFEAFLAVSTPFALPGRSSFLGKTPGTLEEVVGRTFDVDALMHFIVTAYADFGVVSPIKPSATPIERAPEFRLTATANEAIGVVGAGRDAAGRLRLGGELLASRDAVRRVAEETDALPPEASEEQVGLLVDRTFGDPAVALDGVVRLSSIRDVLIEARRAT